MPFARYYDPIALVSIGTQPVAFSRGFGTNMRITIERSMDHVPDKCSVSIEGLDPVRSLAMGAAFRTAVVPTPVTVQLGYDSFPVACFTGFLESFRANVPNGPALWTHATAGDAPTEFENAKLPPMSTAGLTPADMIAQAIARLGLIAHPTVAAVVAGANPVAQSPFTAVGVRLATDLLDEACRTLRCRWWVRDGMVHMSRNGLPDPAALAVVIAPNAPGPAFPGVPLVSEPTFGGGGLISATTFLDPGFVPGGQAVYQGVRWRVEHVIHSLETRSTNPWTSQIVGRTL